MAKMRSGFMLLVSMMSLISSVSYGYKFNVGGKDGWAVKPSGGYSKWAHSLRFQINDSLYFKYDKANDSVLVVNGKDYYSCNTKSPIKKLEGGESIVNLDRSGALYFISGNVENCGKGEKLSVVVLSPRGGHKDHGPAKSPLVAPVHSPAPSWKAPAPVWEAPSPSWMTPAPAGKAPGPSWTAPAPGYKAPSPSAPGWTAPSPSAPGWKAPSPSWTSPAPEWAAPAPGSAPGRKAPAPAPSGTAPSPGSNAPAPSVPGWTSPAPSQDWIAPSDPGWTSPAPSAPEWNAPAPSPRSSGSTNLSVSHGVIVAVVMVIANFLF